MRARCPKTTPSSCQSSRSSAGIARKSIPFATNTPAYCESSSDARNAEISFTSTTAGRGAFGRGRGPVTTFVFLVLEQWAH